MTPQQRRAAGRRRAWGRGPVILQFERLEGRQLLTASSPPQPLPDLVGADFATAHSLNWGNTFQAIGTILNQGNATTTSPFNVEVYAATATTIGADSVPLGVVTIPAGLGPNQTANFDQNFSLPATAIPNYSSANPIYIDLFVNPNKAVTESNYKNNEGVGQGFDSSPIVVVPQQPSLLVGSSLSISPTSTTWGQTITVTAQIRNNAQGNAQATRAKLVITPSGLAPGSPYDFTVGYLDVPAIPAWQTVNVQQQITLPATAPSSLTSDTQFTLSMAQDADYVADPIYPHVATQGQGLDTTPLTIAPATNTRDPDDHPGPSRRGPVQCCDHVEVGLLGLQLPGQLDVPEPGSDRRRPGGGHVSSDRHRRYAWQRRLPRRIDPPRPGTRCVADRQSDRAPTERASQRAVDPQQHLRPDRGHRRPRPRCRRDTPVELPGRVGPGDPPRPRNRWVEYRPYVSPSRDQPGTATTGWYHPIINERLSSPPP